MGRNDTPEGKSLLPFRVLENKKRIGLQGALRFVRLRSE
jgi:hypothetical protein